MFVFFFKQKTAYEMRISDWSSDVCSSDLTGRGGAHPSVEADARDLGFAMVVVLRIDAASVGRPLDRVDAIIPIGGQAALARSVAVHNVELEIGRASCRERVCQYV